MSKSRHTEAEMMAALKQLEAGRKAEDVAREVGVSKHTIYSWKPKSGGMDVSEAQRGLGRLLRSCSCSPQEFESSRRSVRLGRTSLLNCTGDRRKGVIRVRAHEPNRTNDQHQDHGEHHRQYALTWAKNTGRTVAVDMVDEIDANWGSAPTPTDGRWLGLPYPIPDNAFTTLMNIVNGVPGRSSVSYPPTGAANSQIVQNWEGNPAFSDYATMYWTRSGNEWEQLYPWAYSVHQDIYNLDRTLADRLPVMQRNKPLLLLTGTTGPYYKKLGPGNQYTPGQDQLISAGVSPESVEAQTMYAIAKGFAGVRAYGFDNTNDLQSRQNDPSGSWEQTFASPTTVGVSRWRAMSNAFNLIKTLEPYILQPQTNAEDLGSSIYTGAKSGPNGRLFIAINSLEVPQTVKADLTPYLYASGSIIQRYRVSGTASSNTALPNQTPSDTVTLNPGESAVWIIHQ